MESLKELERDFYEAGISATKPVPATISACGAPARVFIVC